MWASARPARTLAGALSYVALVGLALVGRAIGAARVASVLCYVDIKLRDFV